MTTLEKAAKAVEAEMGQLGYIPHDTEAFARAAIEALREPSEGMRKAASECAFDRATFAYPKGHASYEVHVSAEEYWQAMIDHILNEEAS